MSDRSDKNRPSFDAFHVKEGADDKPYFNRVGVAFAHRAREEKPRRRNREQRDR